MARHARDMASVNDQISMIKNENKTVEEAFFNNQDDVAQTFKNQQHIMEFTIHACDLSQPTRDFEEVKEWTYLLFQEFFEQGDMEKDQGLPLSMLCDRDNTNVAATQPGFINFVTFPLFNTLSNIVPTLAEKGGCIDRIKENKAKWVDYKENDDDKRVYIKTAEFG